MNNPDAPTRPAIPLRSITTIAVALLVAAWAVSGQSFWMDEGYTLRLTWGHSFSQFLKDFRECNLADGAMPVYMAWIWLVTDLSGPSEFWIRFLGNAPWFVFSVAAGVWIARRLRLPALPLLLMVSPFTWFYLDELRPYVMQIMGGTMALAYAVTWAQTGHARPAAWQAAGIFVAAGSSLTEFVSLACWMGVAILFLPSWNRDGWCARIRGAWVGVTLLGPWAVFYIWRSLQGQVHSPFWQLSPMHAVFSLYEFFGFSGMGPERGALRELAGTG